MLRQLLGNGRAAAHFAAPTLGLLLVVFPGFADGIPFYAFMVREIGVFRGDYGTLQVIAYAVVWNPLIFQFSLRVSGPQLGQGGVHEGAAAGVFDTYPEHHRETSELIKQQVDRKSAV